MVHETASEFMNIIMHTEKSNHQICLEILLLEFTFSIKGVILLFIVVYLPVAFPFTLVDSILFLNTSSFFNSRMVAGRRGALYGCFLVLRTVCLYFSYSLNFLLFSTISCLRRSSSLKSISLTIWIKRQIRIEFRCLNLFWVGSQW